MVLLYVKFISKAKHVNVSASLMAMMANSSATFRIKSFLLKYCHFHDLTLFLQSYQWISVQHIEYWVIFKLFDQEVSPRMSICFGMMLRTHFNLCHNKIFPSQNICFTKRNTKDKNQIKSFASKTSLYSSVFYQLGAKHFSSCIKQEFFHRQCQNKKVLWAHTAN